MESQASPGLDNGPEHTFYGITKEDDIRAQELYQYFKPPSSDGGELEVISSDSVLTAHAQLVSWRLDTQRAMISLIDRETQYFVAESTKTLDLKNCAIFEADGDGQWAGVSSHIP